MKIRSNSLASNPLQKIELIFSILIILLAFSIRLHNLGGDSYWIDEISTAYVTDRGWRAIEGDNTHPGLFFLITAGSFSIFGDNEFAGRLLSLFTGTLAIALIVVAGRMLGRTSIGLWAALLLALSPLHLRHSHEARMYALLMALSLLSFILLYQALKRPRWSVWIAYAVVTVLNLYTHYGALIVLASQSILIAIWSLRQLLKGNKKPLAFPIVSAALVAILYAPWLPRFLDSLQYNVGAETVTDTGTRPPLMDWFALAYRDFGMFDDNLAILFLALCLLGLVFLMIKRRWQELAWILIGLLMPLLLIYVFQVARGAYSRYIIYMLPFYLLAIAYVIDTILFQINQRIGIAFYSAGLIIVAIVFFWIAWPQVQIEQEYVLEDWRGIVNYLERNAEDGDVLLAMSMDFPRFNNVNHALPTYLEQTERSYQLLIGNGIRLKDITTLKESDKNVWAVVSHWRPIKFKEKSFEVENFVNDLYVVHDIAASGNALVDAIDLYEQILSFANEPLPQCLLGQDLSTFYLAIQDYWMAKQYFDESAVQCPNLSNTNREVLAQQITEGFESQDWSDLVEYLDNVTNEGDHVLSLNLTGDRSDKRVTGSLPYYLEQSSQSLKFIAGNPLKYESMTAISNKQKDLWVVASIPEHVVSSVMSPEIGVDILKVNDGIYLFHDQEGNILNKVIEVYQDWLIPKAANTFSFCELQSDVTWLFLAIEDYTSFAHSLIGLESQCRETLHWQELQKELHSYLRHAFEQHVQEEEQQKAREAASLLLGYDPKDSTVLDAATAYNLLEQLQNGNAIVNQNGAPEPVEIWRFMMPKNGDWGDVIMIHPPGSVTYHLSLPAEPVVLRSRLALAPESWQWDGDGVTFVIQLQEGNQPPFELYRKHISNEPADQRWHELEVPLTDYGDQDVLLTLRTEVGPAGDGTGDWAGWETPRLLWDIPDIEPEMNQQN